MVSGSDVGQESDTKTLLSKYWCHAKANKTCDKHGVRVKIIIIMVVVVVVDTKVRTLVEVYKKIKGKIILDSKTNE